MHKISFAIQTPEVRPTLPVALLTGNFAEKIEKAARLGAQGVELMTTRPKDLDPAEIRDLLRAHGVQAAAVSSGALAYAEGMTLLHEDPLRASQARMRLLQLIEFAAQVEAPVVTIGSFRGRLKSIPGQPEEILAEILDGAADMAAQRSVRLVIEPLNRYETDFLRTIAEALAFIRGIGQPNIGVLLDTFHANIEESSWAAPLQKAGEANRLWHVHLADNNRLPPGQGLIDFRAILAGLAETGYSGFLSAELLAKPDPDEAARLTITHIQSLSKS